MLDSKFDVFISHSSQDKPLALNLYYNILANGKVPWFDAGELSVSDSVFSTLADGINRSSGYLLIASAASQKSDFVQYELACVQKRIEKDKEFKIWILLTDESVELQDWLKKHLYVEIEQGLEQESFQKIVEAITGKSWILDLTKSMFLSNVPLLTSQPINSMWDLILRQQMIRLSQFKSLLENPGHTFEEIKDTMDRISEISIFRQLPVWQPYWAQVDVGVYETTFPVRMRIPPRVKLDGLPDAYSWKFIEHSAIHCVIEIIDNKTEKRVDHVVPFLHTSEFDAEL